QQFEDARRQGEIDTRFAAANGRLAGPGWDPDLEALGDVMDGDPRVFFRADRADDMRRVIGLADTYGFRPIIVGGEEAWKVADMLRESDVPVLVSLDFPTPRRWDPDDEPEEPDEAAADTAEAEAEEPEPLDAAALEEKQRIEEAYANAGRLEAEGVTFALTSGGGEADILEGVRKAVEYGLSEAAALRALTAAPAELLGVPRLARIESDAPATFIVADGALFEEDAEIAYTFVEGRLEEGSTGGPQAGDEPPAVDVTGTWEVEATVQGQSQAGTMRLTQDGASFEGTWETEQGAARVVDGVVSAGDVVFTLLIDAGGQEIEASMSGSVEGDRASGSGSTSFGAESASLSWTARRTSETPERARGGGTR
ncbi:MAG: amidohydrolase family protein, partial [Gemmatimonadota bacterium]